jgi:hypothetical protein
VGKCFFAGPFNTSWLVFVGWASVFLPAPSTDVLAIYSQPDQHKTFDRNDSEIVDEVMDIHLPLQKIFEW